MSISPLGRSSVKMITGAAVVRGNGQVTQETVVIEDSRIAAISPAPPASLLLNTEDVEIVSGQGCLLTPGLIEQHFHGGFGCHFNQATIAEIHHLLANLPAFGVTSTLPTVMTAPQMDMLTAVTTLEEVIHLGRPKQSRILGLHLEGPFLNPDYRGAHPLEDLLPPTVDAMRSLMSPNLKLVTLAPEMDPKGEVIQFLRERGIIVSAGHSGATLQQMEWAIRRGVTGVTHLFNAMCPFHHREPGLVGAALNRDELIAEIIGDGFHVSPEAIRMALRAKSFENMILISDCLPLSGLPENTTIEFGKQPITNRQGRAVNPDGNLAGGTLFLNECFKNMVRWGLLPPHEAVQMASSVSADFLGVGHELGRIETGYLADLVLWDLKALTVQSTWIDGELVYQRPQPQALEPPRQQSLQQASLPEAHSNA
jgi:N-acetylglucosamine-6-phosphate deacetylase